MSNDAVVVCVCVWEGRGVGEDRRWGGAGGMEGCRGSRDRPELGKVQQRVRRSGAGESGSV